MIRSHEAFCTKSTGETFLSGMSAEVTLELVGPCETFSTEEPVTDERSFSGVPSDKLN